MRAKRRPASADFSRMLEYDFCHSYAAGIKDAFDNSKAPSHQSRLLLRAGLALSPRRYTTAGTLHFVATMFCRTSGIVGFSYFHSGTEAK
jgi:hypothetical protein